MAENNKGGILNTAEKILRRRKAKVLQSLGKQEKTTDELLVEDCQRLEKQQEIANKFQKDLRSYIQNAKALAATSKHFYITVTEAYEPEWEKHAQVVEILKNMDMLWTDYIDKLQVQVFESLTKYLAHIPTIKAKVAKRGRKLMDYDNAKHNLEIQQNAKKKDEAKITKAQQDLEQVKKIYEDMNNDLHQELPEFYNSRVNFYGNLFQSLFSAEAIFHTETGKVWMTAPSCNFEIQGADQISSFTEKLALDHAHCTYTPRRNVQSVAACSNEHLINGHSDNGHSDSGQEGAQTATPSPSCTFTTTTLLGCQPLLDTDQKTNWTADTDESKSNQVTKYADESKSDQMTKDADKSTSDQIMKDAGKSKDYNEDAHNEDLNSVKTTHEVIVTEIITETVVTNVEVAKPLTDSTKNTVEMSEPNTDENIKDSPDRMKEVKVNGKLDITISDKVEPCGDVPPPPPLSPPPDEIQSVTDDGKYDGDIEYENLHLVHPTVEALANDLPHKYIYTVLATHAYQGEDDDELSFHAHDIIYVTEFDDPEEQDPGWLMGVSKTTGQTGVFPENFTRKVE